MGAACWTLDAPESAINVPANADVDHVGKFDDNGELMLAAGFVE